MVFWASGVGNAGQLNVNQRGKDTFKDYVFLDQFPWQ